MFVYKENMVEQLTEKIRAFLGEDLFTFEMSYDFPVYVINKHKISSLFKLLFEDKEFEFRFLTTLCGIHYPEKQQLGVVYHLHSFKNNLRIRIKSFTDINDPVFDSLTDIFATANWMERETYDFFGIIFKGHPNLKRILNVDDMDYFPMRKEYPLEDQTRDDKKDDMFGR
jgi:NADH-quinone oxidoreductase subunit C